LRKVLIATACVVALVATAAAEGRTVFAQLIVNQLSAEHGAARTMLVNYPFLLRLFIGVTTWTSH